MTKLIAEFDLTESSITSEELLSRLDKVDVDFTYYVEDTTVGTAVIKFEPEEEKPPLFI